MTEENIPLEEWLQQHPAPEGGYYVMNVHGVSYLSTQERMKYVRLKLWRLDLLGEQIKESEKRYRDMLIELGQLQDELEKLRKKEDGEGET